MFALVILLVVLVIVLFAVFVLRIVNAYREKARRAGYGSLREYLDAVPCSDEEKRDAVDLALKGLILCIIGLLLPPLLLLGAFPLYYGARKIALSSMGLGLLDDSEPTRR